MTKMDWEKERERLRQLYAGMHDGELEKIARAADSLTLVARATLRAEMLGRGLDAPPEAAPESVEKEPDLPGPVIIGRYQGLPAASIAQSILDSAGIEAFLSDDNLIRMDWLWSNAVGGIKLLVREEDAEAARKLLEQAVPEGFEVEGLGEYQQPRCPECGAMDVFFEEIDKKIAYPLLYVCLPVAVTRKGWSCHSCGHIWNEDADVSSSPFKDAGNQPE